MTIGGLNIEALLSRLNIAEQRNAQAEAQRRAQQAAAAQQGGQQQGGCGQQQGGCGQQQQPGVDAAQQSGARQCAAGSEQARRQAVENPQQSTETAQRPRRGLQAQPEQEQAQQPQQTEQQRNLQRGHRGEDVRELQRQLNRHGAKLEEDGKFGPKTQAALNEFQRRQGWRADGVAGPQTREALARDPAAGTQRTQGRTQREAEQSGEAQREQRAGRRQTGRTQRRQTREAQRQTGDTRRRQRPSGAERPQGVDDPQPRRAGDPPNRTATFDRVSRAGQRNQMVTGRITVNGNTYTFNSGGFGRGNLPRGEYTVSNLRGTNQRGMVRDGVGFKADVSDKYDPRVGATRSLLRIHPDGGSAGTQGCIGIVGDRATLERFRRDLAAELRRNGGRFTLRVG
jgi:peptidoglycan hydrolase-like protein with peptidoglycan-binding domain